MIGFFKNIGNMLGELDNFVDGLNPQIDSSTNKEQNIHTESKGQSILPVISNTICFYCGSEVGEDVVDCPICHNKLK